MGNFTRKVISMIWIVLALTVIDSSACQLNVRNFGAGEKTGNNSAAFQRCLLESASKGCSCFVPNGIYVFKNDIFMSNGSSLIGQSKSAKLIFEKGGIRGYKNNSGDFYYTNNYNNEVVPSEIKTELKVYAKKGTNYLTVDDVSIFKPGSEIVVFDNKLDSWTILENSNKSNVWNGVNNQYFVKGGSFSVKSIKGNELILDSLLPFDLLLGSKIAIRSGITNVTVKNLFIERKTPGYAIHFEQPKNVKLNKLVVNGFGGIALSHFANRCLIEGNEIDSKNGYAINIENFSSNNSVLNNKVVFRRTDSDNGGDCAVILLMGAYNNDVVNNDVKNVGGRYKDFGGIFSHALTFDNRITNNIISGAAEGIGTYYGAYNNIFKENTISKVRVGIMSYYSQSNTYMSNILDIRHHGDENSYGILDFGTLFNKYDSNVVSGIMTFGIQIQTSKAGEFKHNKFKQLNTSYSVRVNISNSDLLKESIYEHNSFTGYIK